MFSKETNLEAVKSEARAFLYLDIKVEEKFGLFVQHPYFGQVVDAVQVNGKLEMVDLREPEGLRKVRERVRKTIDAVEHYSQFFVFVRAPFLPAFFKFTQSHLSLKDYSEALADVWTLVEFPNVDVNVSTREFIEYFQRAHKEWLMDEDEYEFYKNLPEEITVYRGTGKGARHLLGLSWTLDYEKAKWFATRWNKKGVIYKGKILKENVLAYFSRRNESEVVIDVGKLIDVEEVPYEFNEGDNCDEQ